MTAEPKPVLLLYREGDGPLDRKHRLFLESGVEIPRVKSVSIREYDSTVTIEMVAEVRLADNVQPIDGTLIALVEELVNADCAPTFDEFEEWCARAKIKRLAILEASRWGRK